MSTNFKAWDQPSLLWDSLLKSQVLDYLPDFMLDSLPDLVPDSLQNSLPDILTNVLTDVLTDPPSRSTTYQM